MVTSTEGVSETGTEVFGQYIQWMEAYFYANCVLLASTLAARLHQAFNVLTDIFDWFGLKINVGKTISMF